MSKSLRKGGDGQGGKGSIWALVPFLCHTWTGRRAPRYCRFTTATDTAVMVLRTRARGAATGGSSLLSTGGTGEACLGGIPTEQFP